MPEIHAEHEGGVFVRIFGRQIQRELLEGPGRYFLPTIITDFSLEEMTPADGEAASEIAFAQRAGQRVSRAMSGAEFGGETAFDRDGRPTGGPSRIPTACPTLPPESNAVLGRQTSLETIDSASAARSSKLQRRLDRSQQAELNCRRRLLNRSTSLRKWSKGAEYLRLGVPCSPTTFGILG